MFEHKKLLLPKENVIDFEFFRKFKDSLWLEKLINLDVNGVKKSGVLFSKMYHSKGEFVFYLLLIVFSLLSKLYLYTVVNR